MKVVCDIEANSLLHPTKIWLIVCKDIDTGEYHIFRDLANDVEETKRFLEFSKDVDLWIGHNFLNYDYPVMVSLINLNVGDCPDSYVDTLIVSRLVDYPRSSHSIEAYGEEFGIPKGNFNDWTHFSKDMENYCIRDVDICHKIYLKYLRYLNKTEHKVSIALEHKFQLKVCNTLETNGFMLDTNKANNLLTKVTKELAILDEDILKEFPPRLKLVREIHPRTTRHGTLNRSDFRFVKDGNLSDYNGGPFSLCSWVPFNPSSHKQLVDTLHSAGWDPVDKTQSFIDTERELAVLKRSRNKTPAIDLEIEQCHNKIVALQKYGWKINENNLSSLPDSAPSSARTLAKRIMLESRRRTLTEWLSLANPDTERIHGRFLGIGAWTHRMAHQRPNTANIPNEFDTNGKKKLLGKELRALWKAPRNRLLVGVDAEGIQLRIFAHYINDPEFTDALVKGRKDDKTDPHSLNQRVLGPVCLSRAAAKRFIYALLLGAGIGKLAQILDCSVSQAQEALGHLLERYTGFAFLKREIIPKDAQRGYFIGLDGRKVAIPGATTNSRAHLCMSGYLQCGEAVVMKKACLLWLEQVQTDDKLNQLRERMKNSEIKLVNFVHDEWQTEVPNNVDFAKRVAEIQADSLRIVGEELKLKCPLAGSYWNDDLKDFTIGTNWSVTH